MKTITSDRLEQQVFTMARKGHFSYIPKGKYFLKGRKGDTIYYLEQEKFGKFNQYLSD